MVGFYFPDGNDEFEYDVRGLMTSFFPGCEPVKLAGRPDAEEALDFERILRIPAFPEITDKGERKNETKRAFYRELSEMTGGKTLPWGTLTGIRPTKLITQYLEAGHPEFDTAESKGFRSLMKEKYLIPRFTFDGTLVTIDEKEAESGVSMFDFTKPVVLTVHTSAKSVSYKMYVHAYTGLPLLYIDIAGKQEVTSKDYYLDATLRLVEDVKTRAAGDVVSAPVHIKGRGNSSWTQPKKPYRLKFDEKIALLGEHKDKSWVLVANYSDKSMLRNSLSYYMGKVSNLEWTPSSHFVELFINGQHRGTYLLCEKVKVAKHRVNVGDDGFLLECNRWADQEDGNVYFYTPNLTPAIVVKEPDVVAGDANFEYVRNYMLTAEQVLFSANFADPNVGWQKYMDMDSFVDWYLIHEMSKNVDCMFNFSTYMNLPRGGKLRMGPIWDFDIAYGNIKQSDSGYLKWVFPSGNLLSVTKWYSRLMKDPAFVAKLKERFNYFYSHKNEFLTYLNESAQYLRYSVEENEAKWGTLYHYTFKNYNIWGSYFNEVQDLKEWLNARLDWMKEDYDKLKP